MSQVAFPWFFANRPLAPAFRRRNMPALHCCLEPAKVLHVRDSKHMHIVTLITAGINMNQWALKVQPWLQLSHQVLMINTPGLRLSLPLACYVVRWDIAGSYQSPWYVTWLCVCCELWTRYDLSWFSEPWSADAFLPRKAGPSWWLAITMKRTL